jgi:uracil-DNA glycosylase family 4
MLTGAVQHCTLCSRMCHRNKVLTADNGGLQSQVMFVAEAPGRLGADKTGVPLHGDASGLMFESLLAGIGWARSDVFVTNAVLCNPRDDAGNNDRPTRDEIQNCAAYLEMTINLVDPEVIVPMGAVALEALDSVRCHDIVLRNDVARMKAWSARAVFPLYHPGPRARIHRSAIRQRADMTELSKLVDPATGIRRRPSPQRQSGIAPSQSPFEQVIVALTSVIGTGSYFRLTKLLYLVDLVSTQRRGMGATGQVYLRAQAGPWSPELPKAIQRLDGHEVTFAGGGKRPRVALGPSPRFTPDLDDDVLEAIADVVARYGGKNEAELKTAVYLTDPMRAVLKREKGGEDMRNAIVLDARPPRPNV